MDKSKLEICLKTLEPIYDYKTLKKIALTRLSKSKNIHSFFNSQITHVSINHNGS